MIYVIMAPAAKASAVGNDLQATICTVISALPQRAVLAARACVHRQASRPSPALLAAATMPYQAIGLL